MAGGSSGLRWASFAAFGVFIAGGVLVLTGGPETTRLGVKICAAGGVTYVSIRALMIVKGRGR
jgi:hypothetical protein